jgi:hypothetical protein
MHPLDSNKELDSIKMRGATVGKKNCIKIFLLRYGYVHRLRWSRCSVLVFSTQVRGFKLGRRRRIFKGDKILTTPSFGGEVKPSVTCRRFAACKRPQNDVEVVISAKLPDNIPAHSSTFRRWDLSRLGGRGGTWWLKLERLIAGESNGKLPLRICPGCSVPEPYQSPD